MPPTPSATAVINITSGETISSGSDFRSRARNAISTVSQIRSQPERAPELHPSRLFHQDDLFFQQVRFSLQLLSPGCTLLDGPLGLMQKLDALGQLRAPLLNLFS